MDQFSWHSIPFEKEARERNRSICLTVSLRPEWTHYGCIMTYYIKIYNPKESCCFGDSIQPASLKNDEQCPASEVGDKVPGVLTYD